MYIRYIDCNRSIACAKLPLPLLQLYLTFENPAETLGVLNCAMLAAPTTRAGNEDVSGVLPPRAILCRGVGCSSQGRHRNSNWRPATELLSRSYFAAAHSAAAHLRRSCLFIPPLSEPPFRAMPARRQQRLPAAASTSSCVLQRQHGSLLFPPVQLCRNANAAPAPPLCAIVGFLASCFRLPHRQTGQMSS